MKVTRRQNKKSDNNWLKLIPELIGLLIGSIVIACLVKLICPTNACFSTIIYEQTEKLRFLLFPATPKQDEQICFLNKSFQVNLTYLNYSALPLNHANNNEFTFCKLIKLGYQQE